MTFVNSSLQKVHKKRNIILLKKTTLLKDKKSCFSTQCTGIYIENFGLFFSSLICFFLFEWVEPRIKWSGSFCCQSEDKKLLEPQNGRSCCYSKCPRVSKEHSDISCWCGNFHFWCGEMYHANMAKRRFESAFTSEEYDQSVKRRKFETEKRKKE